MGESISNTSTTQSYGAQRYVNKLLGAFLGIAVIGWGASIFLTAVHFWALPLPSGIEPEGSMAVITSAWAYVGPIPLALLGAGYYATMLVLGGLWLETKHDLLERGIFLITLGGLGASAYFVYLQLGVIGAICPFCMMSAAATTSLFTIELVVKYLGGGRIAPPVSSTRIWPPLLVAIIGMTVTAMYGLTLAPIPGT
ncbi:vitamin K epoxide reductase family protein [Natronorubrum thiooxidans]|uniref:Vitamin K epoxide reductase family protein n=1 Tax=Natronorubrum thiooxidans TaxID=308853 RepID=A0A1N7DKT6_9EURY|nr:vitamin K epoxide reductase family protein [Natronorubrum thiooxidans]SIR76391.1 Vitamin K epoxide reductase family protein [Natronorubrum thiooxidans]